MTTCIIACLIEEVPDLPQDCDMYDLTPQELGRAGEAAAARYLEHLGYDILERNWKCRYGEADIIAVDPEDEELVFVEVKTRRSVEAGLPEEAITPKKQARYERIAMSYLLETGISIEFGLRFDGIGVCVLDGTHALLRHNRSCFNALH